MEVGGRLTGSAFAMTALAMLLAGCGTPTSSMTSQPQQPIQYAQPGETNSVSLQTAEYVEGADGTVYSLKCLRANAGEIQQQGKTAMAQCATSQVTSTPLGRSQSKPVQKWLIYPPYYYQPSSLNSNFCSYIFTSSIWNDNCISEDFGYSPIYGSYYNQSCNDCFYFGYTYLCISYCTQPGYYYPY